MCFYLRNFISEQNKQCNYSQAYYPFRSLNNILKENKADYILVAGAKHFSFNGESHNASKFPVCSLVILRKNSYDIFEANGYFIFDRKDKNPNLRKGFINNFVFTSFVPGFYTDVVTKKKDVMVVGNDDDAIYAEANHTRLYFNFTNNYNESIISDHIIDCHYSQSDFKKNSYYIMATNIPELQKFQDKDFIKNLDPIPVNPKPPKPPKPTGGGGLPTEVDLTKINDKIGKLDNLDKLSFLELIYKKCCEIKDKISNLDILKDILDYLKKILYENQKTNDYFSTLMKSLDFDKHKVDNSNFKELFKFLQKFREDLFQDMANLDRDGDHPDLSAIYDINSSILAKLNDFMPDGILQNILSAIESLNTNVGGNLGRLNDNLAVIVRVIGGGGGSGGSTTGGGGSGDTSNNFISSVTNITNNIKNLAGSEEQAKKDLDDLKDNMQKFVNQEPFGSGREAEEQLKKFKVAKPGKSIPVYSIEAFKGIKIPAMDFGPFLGIIADIRKILVAMLWISLFLYLVRVFIPKLKV